MKPKILLLHGALGSASQFNLIHEKLNERYEIHTLNFEGHGGLPTDKEFSIELFAENVIRYLESQSIDNIDVFGYSMGGYVALQTALKAPSKIRSIITLGTKFKWDPESARKEVKMLNPDVIEEKVPQFAKRLKKVHAPQDWKTVMNKTARMMMHMGSGKKLVDSDFKNIHQRVILGIGSLDKMVSYEETKSISKLLPNAKLITLEGVKHPIESIASDILTNYIQSEL